MVHLRSAFHSPKITSPTSEGHPNLCPHLINNVTAGQISHFVGISNANIKCGLSSLLNAHARLRLSLRPVDIGGGLYRRRASETGAILFEMHRVGKASGAGDLGKCGGRLRASSGKRFFLGRGRCLLGRSRGYIGGRFPERAKRIKGVVDGFQTCRLRADLPRSSRHSSSGCPNFGTSS